MLAFFMLDMIFAQEIIDTPMGWMVLKGDQDHVKQAYWAAEEELTIGQGTMPAEWKAQATAQIAEYFKKERSQFSLPLKPEGTAFQEMIWERLLEIPSGTTTSYSEMAGPDQARAVGSAVGANPLLLLIPCHRVIGADGSLTGYAGGKERKEELLRIEGAHLPQQLRLF
jgi:methylated-DNA-[protein]-cysteine S-methyltransferase